MNDEINDDLPSCRAACRCAKSGTDTAQILCANVECPEHFGGSNWNCTSVYDDVKQCCRSNEICGNNFKANQIQIRYLIVIFMLNILLLLVLLLLKQIKLKLPSYTSVMLMANRIALANAFILKETHATNAYAPMIMIVNCHSLKIHIASKSIAVSNSIWMI